MQTDNISSSPVRGKDVLLLVILALSLALNVLLGWKAQSLSNRIEARRSKAIEGLTIQAIAAVNTDGKEEYIVCDAGGQPTVLYVFSPTCVWCDRNLNNVNTLKSNIEQSHRFIGISLSDSGLSEYLRSHQLDFPVYKQPSKEVIRRLDLGATPQTIVISPQGKVLKNWIGAYGSSKPEIEAYFGVQLPGITELQ